MTSEREVLHAAVAARVSPRLVELSTRLRAAGVRCGVGELLAAHESVAQVGPTIGATRAALRCVLCNSPADLAAFDIAFREVFEWSSTNQSELPLKPNDLGARSGTRESRGDDRRANRNVTERGADRTLPRSAGAVPGEDGPVLSPARWSGVELLRDKDFRAYTASDRVLLQAYFKQLAVAMPTRRSARLRPVSGHGQTLDVSRTLKLALQTGGQPLDLRWRNHMTMPRRLVFVCDVSGSMAPYADILLNYAHAVVCAVRTVEVFCFATRLARVTSELRAREADRAIACAEARIPDRSSGTRIGAAIAVLNREHGRRIGRGAVVVIISDGWDRGEPGVLALEMARLRRTAHRVLWLDPHHSTPGYAPLTRGLREALPHTDRLLPAHSLRAVEELAATLAGELGRDIGEPPRGASRGGKRRQPSAVVRKLRPPAIARGASSARPASRGLREGVEGPAQNG